MKCAYCEIAIQGEAYVHGDLVLHASCVAPHRRHLRGLDHECPKCRTTGRTDDPSGKKEKKEVLLAPGDTPDCAYDGCMGCHYCRNGVKRIEVAAQVTCDLCAGEGWLTAPAVPITKVVDWRRS